jgi:hypothetical protein
MCTECSKRGTQLTICAQNGTWKSGSTGARDDTTAEQAYRPIANDDMCTECSKRGTQLTICAQNVGYAVRGWIRTSRLCQPRRTARLCRPRRATGWIPAARLCQPSHTALLDPSSPTLRHSSARRRLPRRRLHQWRQRLSRQLLCGRSLLQQR